MKGGQTEEVRDVITLLGCALLGAGPEPPFHWNEPGQVSHLGRHPAASRVQEVASASLLEDSSLVCVTTGARVPDALSLLGPAFPVGWLAWSSLWTCPDLSAGPSQGAQGGQDQTGGQDPNPPLGPQVGPPVAVRGAPSHPLHTAPKP